MRNWKLFTIALTGLLLLSTALADCSAPVTTNVVKIEASGAAGKPGISQGLTQQIWEENYPFYQKILALPYNQELLSGTLDEDVFRDYIIQDYHFCQNYKKVHGILLAKAP